MLSAGFLRWVGALQAPGGAAPAAAGGQDAPLRHFVRGVGPHPHGGMLHGLQVHSSPLSEQGWKYLWKEMLTFNSAESYDCLRRSVASVIECLLQLPIYFLI